MKLTIDVRDDWMEERIRAGSDDGSNDTEYDLLCEVGEAIESAARAAGVDMTTVDTLRDLLNAPVDEDDDASSIAPDGRVSS